MGYSVWIHEDLAEESQVTRREGSTLHVLKARLASGLASQVRAYSELHLRHASQRGSLVLMGMLSALA